MRQCTKKLILGSRSPRRRQLLADAGYSFEIVPPHDESESSIQQGESPEQYVQRLALVKARDVVGQIEGGRVLTCDTIVLCNGQILGKPMDQCDARRILRALRGREHYVYSGLCLWDYPTEQVRVKAEVTVLQMEELSDEQVEEYLASGLWQGKAGAFGYQDRLGWLRIVSGSESNVVGLPMELLSQMLNENDGLPPS